MNPKDLRDYIHHTFKHLLELIHQKRELSFHKSLSLQVMTHVLILE